MEFTFKYYEKEYILNNDNLELKMMKLTHWMILMKKK